jgi:outer membrane immunogenic protein
MLRRWLVDSATQFEATAMIRYLVCALALLATCDRLFAADLGNYSEPPVGPSFSWTGLHLGVSGGFGFNADDPSYSYVNVPSDVIPRLPRSANLDADGGIIGGTVGYDKQYGQLVVGIEGDLSWTDFGENAIHNVPGDPNIGFPPLQFKTDYDMDWLSTVRARVGIALDRWLLYGTGGLAFGEVSLQSSVTVGQPAMGRLTGSEDATESGWTAGGGGALAVTDNVSLKAEALYYDLGQISSRSTSSADPQNSILITHQDVSGVIVRGGADYRF